MARIPTDVCQGRCPWTPPGGGAPWTPAGIALRFPSGLAVIALALAIAGGCAFRDGNPWGEARFAVSARLDDADRGTDDGYVTSNDFLVEVEEFVVGLQDVSLGMAAEGGVASFDPADPPAGYSLCHNGHCHHDSGELVDYEDIEAELAGESATGGTTTQAIASELVLSETTTAAPLGACSDDCRLGRGSLATVTLRVDRLRMRVHVTDRRTGDRQRLPDEGRTWEIDTPLPPLSLVSTVSGRIDGRRPPLLDIDTELVVPVTLFDGVDWESDDALDQTLVDNLSEDAGFTVGVTRSDF